MKSKGQPSLILLLLSLCVALASTQVTTALRGGSRFLEDATTTDDIADTASQGLATIGIIIIIIVVVVVACAAALIGWFCCCGEGFCGGLLEDVEAD